MTIIDNNKLDIDFSTLWDLRIDFAFKRFFATNDTRRLVSLLNAIFAHKGTERVITALTVDNPFLDKESAEDKLSVLDIRATLADGSIVCIEMHLYGLADFKYKSVRNWARIYGEELQEADAYTELTPVIFVSFLDGAIKDINGQPVENAHSIFHIMERDSHEILLPDLEMHFINMGKGQMSCMRR